MTGFTVLDDHGAPWPDALVQFIDDQVRAAAAHREAETIAVLYVVSFITGVPVHEIIEQRRREVGW